MKPINIIIILFVIVAFASCQKVITVNLNSATPRYVVEGNVVDSPMMSFVKISKSVSFDQDNTFPAISGALVTITDNTLGHTDTLLENADGLYTNPRLVGVDGHSYSLYIKTGDQVFTGKSTMPKRIKMDSIYTQKEALGNNYVVVPVYTDPAATDNYYQFVNYINGAPSTDNFLRDDDLINDQVVKLPLNVRGPQQDLKVGDNVQVFMYCIDSNVYQYFYTLEQTKNQNSATPANPITNLSGGALGYFSARTVNTRSVVVQ